MDVDTQFNTSGKIPTDSNFWDQAVDEFVTSEGFTPKFSRVIAEQVFLPVKSPLITMYNRFTEKPIESGAGFTERIMGKTTSKHFNPKASADDAFRFYDSEGIEKTYKVNVAGWRPVSIPSDLATFDMFTKGSQIARLNDEIYNVMINGYQRDIESMVQKYVSSTIKNDTELTYDPSDLPGLLGQISTLANDLIGEKTAYNELSNDENALIYHGADKGLYAFIDKSLYDKIKNSKAYLPNPSELVENVEFVPVIDGLATPITTAEWETGRGEADSEDTLTWDSKPVAIDESKPDIIICDKRKFGVRPVIRSYKINTNKNGSGDFNNLHMVYKMAIFNRPWYNGIRVTVTPEDYENNDSNDSNDSNENVTPESP